MSYSAHNPDVSTASWPEGKMLFSFRGWDGKRERRRFNFAVLSWGREESQKGEGGRMESVRLQSDRVQVKFPI
ncbi:Rab GTPase-activating protein 1-like [Dissostichus eleginoides]|uniref:Rab GTPase-activating protein 1-like n=1 Tax=Dissostichus eleginoides TaxID=100907 RepID=A0AAD9BDN7_DISEL|nr:Rab GTPase-activating protein 1-like [Dissostichus eleginoides]